MDNNYGIIARQKLKNDDTPQSNYELTMKGLQYDMLDEKLTDFSLEAEHRGNHKRSRAIAQFHGDLNRGDLLPLNWGSSCFLRVCADQFDCVQI